MAPEGFQQYPWPPLAPLPDEILIRGIYLGLGREMKPRHPSATARFATNLLRSLATHAPD